MLRLTSKNSSIAEPLDNVLVYHAEVQHAPMREEHMLWFNWALALAIVLVTLHQRKNRKNEGEPEMFRLKPTGKTNGSLNKSLLSAGPSYGVSDRVSSITVPKGLRIPRAKGQCEPVSGAYIPKGTHKALVIGLNGPVAHKDRRLGYAVQDAKNFENCLKKLNALGQQPNSGMPGSFNFDVEVLTDEGEKCVPRTKIFRALEDLFSGAKPGDLIVLFFSGHCSINQTNGIVSLMTVEDNEKYRLIPSTVFSQYISKLPPGCTLEVFLDCCYSSGLVQIDNVIRKMNSGSTIPGSVHSVTTAACIPPSPAPALAGLPSLGPKGNLNTQAHVVVWAASDITEKAYESCQHEGGPLARTICNEIERSYERGTMVRRDVLWEQVESGMNCENVLRQKILPGTHQHARVLASSQNSEEIMNKPLFYMPLER